MPMKLIPIVAIGMALSSCVSGASPQTITIEHKPDGTTRIEIKKPGVAEQAIEGATTGALNAIKKLFGG